MHNPNQTFIQLQRYVTIACRFDSAYIYTRTHISHSYGLHSCFANFSLHCHLQTNAVSRHSPFATVNLTMRHTPFTFDHMVCVCVFIMYVCAQHFDERQICFRHICRRFFLRPFSSMFLSFSFFRLVPFNTFCTRWL